MREKGLVARLRLFAIIGCLAFPGLRLYAQERTISAKDFEKTLSNEVSALIRPARAANLGELYQRQRQAAEQGDPRNFDKAEWDKAGAIVRDVDEFSRDFESVKEGSRAKPPPDASEASALAAKAAALGPALDRLCQELQIEDAPALKERYFRELARPSPPQPSAERTKRQTESFGAVGKRTGDMAKTVGAIQGAALGDSAAANASLNTLYHGSVNRPGDASGPAGAVKLGPHAVESSGENPGAEKFGAYTTVPTNPVPDAPTAAARAVAQLPRETLRSYNSQDIKDLQKLIADGSQTMTTYYKEHPDWIADNVTRGSPVAGAINNIDQSMKAAGRSIGQSFGMKVDTSRDFERGCVDTQDALLPAQKEALPKDSGLQVKAIDVGVFPQHHAVIVYPKGTDYKRTGVVMDPWTKQSPKPGEMVYAYDEWGRLFSVLRLQSEEVR